jgi:prepilin-type N-terminal cleavage/methylation domain-containing protein/prepilin-type processing-associated H-X9-DG protein
MCTRAFTIVEVLVTVAVIAILVGLLTPAISRAGQGSRSIKCQSNLKQMAVAAQGYAAVYDNWPVAIRYASVGGVQHRLAWDWVTTATGQLVSPGLLWNFADNPDDVQQCPEFHGPSTFSGDPQTGYNYNTTYIGAEISQTGHVRRGTPPHTCSRSSSCVMFGDGGWKDGANKFMRAPLRSEGLTLPMLGLYSGGQAFRQAGHTNVAFVDGHIGTLNRAHEGNLATSSLLNQMDYPRNGFLSDDDSMYKPN